MMPSEWLHTAKSTFRSFLDSRERRLLRFRRKQALLSFFDVDGMPFPLRQRLPALTPCRQT
jgi:hypothetical protein